MMNTSNIIDDLKTMMFTARVSASKAICENVVRDCPDASVRESASRLAAMYDDVQAMIDEYRNTAKADVVIDELETMHDRLDSLIDRHAKLVSATKDHLAIASAETDKNSLRMLRM